GIVSAIVLARHVRPAEFGAVAVGNVFVGLGSLVTGFGLAPPIVSNHVRDTTTLRALHWLALLVSLTVALGIVLGSRLVASYFADAQIGGILAVLSASIPLSAAAVVPTALLQRENRFAYLASTAVLSQLTGSALVVVLSLLGYGIWAAV